MIGKKSRFAGAASVALGLTLAGVCLAQAVDPNNAASVTAWKTNNKITDKVGAATWQAIGATPDGLLYRGVLTQRDPASNQANVGVRVEHFTAAPGPGGMQVLSELDSFLVDCAAPNGGRIKQTKTTFYPQHNMVGTLQDLASTDDWAPTSSIDILVPEVQAACRAAAGGARVATAGAAPGAAGRAPAPFNVRDDNAGRRWILSEKIDQGGSASTPDWPLLGFQADGAMFRSAKSDDSKGSRGTPRYLLREEFYGPVPMSNGKMALSQSTDYDINCSRGQIRKVQTTMFTSRNLSGENVVTPVPNAAFAPIDTDPVMKSAFDDICAQSDKDLENGAGKFQRKG